MIYYVGPVDPVREEVVGPAGLTTATRMDKFTRTMLEQTGLLGMIAVELGKIAIDAIRDNKAVSMIAVGGAAYLVAKAITGSTLLAFPELGMEAIYEFEVKDMPVTVSVDASGESVHIEGTENLVGGNCRANTCGAGVAPGPSAVLAFLVQQRRPP